MVVTVEETENVRDVTAKEVGIISKAGAFSTSERVPVFCVCYGKVPLKNIENKHKR